MCINVRSVFSVLCVVIFKILKTRIPLKIDDKKKAFLISLITYCSILMQMTAPQRTAFVVPTSPLFHQPIGKHADRARNVIGDALSASHFSGDSDRSWGKKILARGEPCDHCRLAPVRW